MKTINTHVSDAEHAFLKFVAGRDKRTISDIIREWIRREQAGDVYEQLRLLAERVKALERR